MVNSKASSVAPLTSAAVTGSAEPIPEQPRHFHFAVTWVTLFAPLDPIEATGPQYSFAIQPRETAAPLLALVPVVVHPPPPPQPEMPLEEMSADSCAAWEMVVPKMVRTGPGNFAPAGFAEPARKQRALTEPALL